MADKAIPQPMVPHCRQLHLSNDRHVPGRTQETRTREIDFVVTSQTQEKVIIQNLRKAERALLH